MHFKPKVCLTCGDAGFPEALVYCIKCKSCAVHRYCLPTVIFRSDVDWLCDDCEPRIPISPALRETVHATLRDRGGKSQEQNKLDDRIVTKKTMFSGAAESSCQEATDFREIKSNEAPTLKVRTLDRDCLKDIEEEQLEEKNGPVGTLSNEANTSYTRASIPPGFEKYVEAQQNEVSIRACQVKVERLRAELARVEAKRLEAQSTLVEEKRKWRILKKAFREYKAEVYDKAAINVLRSQAKLKKLEDSHACEKEALEEAFALVKEAITCFRCELDI